MSKKRAWIRGILFFAVLACLGLGVWHFKRMVSRTAAIQAACAADRAAFEAERASLWEERATLARTCAELRMRLAERTNELAHVAADKDALAKNLLGAIASCDKLQAEIRRLKDANATLVRTLEEERRQTADKAQATAARDAALVPASDGSLQELLKLTDQAPRKKEDK